MPLADVRFWGNSGHHNWTASRPLDPKRHWSIGPALGFGKKTRVAKVMSEEIDGSFDNQTIRDAICCYMASNADAGEKQIVADAPLLETDLNKKMKTYMEQNIAAVSEFAQKASNAKDFQDFWRIQTEFMQAQWKAFTEQTKDLAESAAKSVPNVMKDLSS
jgi:hypothetical protein